MGEGYFMCSICGVWDISGKGIIDKNKLEKMNSSLSHRGPDDRGCYFASSVAFGHNRLAVMDVEKGKQPMQTVRNGYRYTIIYNGEIYNTNELREDLEKQGVEFKTTCDTEVLLECYAVYGTKCLEMLNGIFAFAIHDEKNDLVFFARDRLGVKPFFYAFDGDMLLFSSEIKGLLEWGIKPVVDNIGLWQLLYLSPATIPGISVFEGIKELKPAEYALLDKRGFHIHSYWTLPVYEWKGTREDAIVQTKFLIEDAVKRQLVSDVPLCVLLSGGLDSSAVTAFAAARGGISTYSFEYEGNRESFVKSLFQPESDEKYAISVAAYLGTNHTILTATSKDVAENLPVAAIMRDFPGQADIDSSLLYFCGKIKEKHTVALSGECSDELFGGYPWFYRPEMLQSGFFPWIHDPDLRISLFDERVARPKEGYEFISEIYKKSLDKCPVADNDSDTMRNSRTATWLSMNYFMTSLLERKDRMSMAKGVEIRVPFADHRLWEYVFNIPWEIKFENNVEKSLLREVMKEYLPDSILHRKKSPYPKTHNPEYMKIVSNMLDDRIKKGGILSQILNKKKLSEIKEKSGGTWLGQLMSTPQLIAWLVQFDYWFEEKGIILKV